MKSLLRKEPLFEMMQGIESVIRRDKNGVKRNDREKSPGESKYRDHLNPQLLSGPLERTVSIFLSSTGGNSS